MLELVGVGNDVEVAIEAARRLDGVCYLADPNDERDLPFRTMVRCVTDSPQDLESPHLVSQQFFLCCITLTLHTSSPTPIGETFMRPWLFGITPECGTTHNSVLCAL